MKTYVGFTERGRLVGRRLGVGLTVGGVLALINLGLLFGSLDDNPSGSCITVVILILVRFWAV